MKTLKEMTGKKGERTTLRSNRWSVLAISLLVPALVAGDAAAKSLYVITQITSYDEPTPIHAYDIGPDGLLTFQAEYKAPFYGSGVVGLAINSQTEHLFVTYEDSDVILTFHADTLTGTRTNHASTAKNLAGIVYDHGRQMLYVVDRETTDLYTYRWDGEEENLVSVAGSPFTLEGAFAYGIALDEISGLLYVGNASREITVYSTWDWRLMQRIPISRVAISVAVDPVRGYLYYGAGYAYSYYLSRVDLATGAEREVQIAEDAGVIGLGVDPATGFVYVSTGRDNRSGGDDLMVFNPDLEVMQTVEDVGNPTGLVVPGTHTGYNPLNLQKAVKSPLGGQPDPWELPQIAIGDEVTYVIHFEHSGYDLQNISIIDRLPHETSFVRATGDGSFGRYDPDTHTYRWTNPPLAAGTTNLELTARLLPETPPDHVVVNLVTMNTDKTPPTTTGVEAVATEVVYQPLNISKTVLTAEGQQGDSTQSAYAVAGERFTYRICIDNKDNEYTVDNVTVIDRLPSEVTFIEAVEVDTVSGRGESRIGEYDATTHTYSALYPSLAAGEVRCIDLTVQLRADLDPGTTVANRVEVASDEVPAADDSAEVIVGYLPLELRKTIVSPSGETDDRGRIRIEAGESITYGISFRNPAESKTVSQIALVDSLPAEVNFVTADGDRDFGSYDANDHSYTWQYYAPLAPGEEVRLELVGQVRADTEPNTVISNSVIVHTRQTAPSQARVDAMVVVTPVKGELLTRPTRLLRDDPESEYLLVSVYFPEGVGSRLIADVPLVLYPGGAQSTSMRIYGTSAQGKIRCLFAIGPILKATEGTGEFPISVTGRLVDGRSFVARGTIWIGSRSLPR